MSEASVEPQEGRGLPFAWRRLLWRRAARKEEAEAKQLPPLGTLVGGYLLEARRGQGGFGTVYRARSGERLYAVKFIPLRHARTWGTREMEVLLRLGPQGIASLEGHGYWPVHTPRFLYIVTRYVAGRTVSAWARERNPTARQVARLLLGLARVLVAVHRAGVVHADVKGANVLVRDEDGEVILVDFGAATYAGAPSLTPHLPPGTPHYRSPEALRFLRQHRRGESYRSTPGDDLWALGVLLSWLLTGTWPFDVTEPEAALHQEPVPPRERNPRVPEALGAVCLRLLARAPEARYPEARAVVAALEEVLEGADARWDVPLCEAYGPDTATTPVEVELDTEEATARLERLATYAEQHPPVRGRPPPPEEASTLAPATVTAPPTSEPPEERGAVRQRPRWSVWLWLAVGLVLGLLAARLLQPGPTEPPPAQIKSETLPTVLVVPGQDVASERRPTEPGRSAAPSGAATPVLVAAATPRKEETRVKKPPQDTKKGQRSLVKQAGVVATCTLLAGCAAKPVVPVIPVKQLPPPAPCPRGAVETMQKLGIRVGDTHHGSFVLDEMTGVVSVREGQVVIDVINDWKQLPQSALLQGRIFLMEDRVYGQFTEALLKDGTRLPVCIDMYDRSVDQGWGVVRKPGGEPGTARIWSTVALKAVDRFE